MNERQRVLNMLKGKKPDRVPWLGDLAYWAYARIRRGEVAENFFNSKEYYDWHRELNVGFYLQGYEPYSLVCEGIEIKTWTEGDISYKEIVTPKGNLREAWKYLPDSFTIGPVEHLLKSVEDLPALKCFFENTHFTENYDEATRRYEMIGDNGLVLCYLPKSPFMHLVALLAGIETVVNLFMADQDGFEDLLSVMEKNFEGACEIALNSPAECLMIPENLSSEVVGKKFFEKYMRSYQERWVKKINDKCKYSFIHMDGTLKGLLAEEASVGFTVLEALTPEPCGDISIQQLAEKANNDKTILWGDARAYFTDVVSDEEFIRHTQEVLEVMTREPRYVLGVADQVPPDANPARVRMVSELVEKYGVYS